MSSCGMCPSLVTAWKHFDSPAHKPSLKRPIPCVLSILARVVKWPSLMLTGRLPMFSKANSIPLDPFTMNIIRDPSGSKVSRFKQGCTGVCLWPLTCFGSHYFVRWNLCKALYVRSPCQRKARGASVAPAVSREVPSIQKLPQLYALKVKLTKKILAVLCGRRDGWDKGNGSRANLISRFHVTLPGKTPGNVYPP